jgi:hypothetical protein
MSKGFPGKLRNRELTGKLLQHAPDLSTNPKLWDLILPRDLKEWDTEGALIYALWEDRFQHILMIDEPQCKETLLECATFAELLTTLQDLCVVHIRDLESGCSLSYKLVKKLRILFKSLRNDCFNIIDPCQIYGIFMILYSM